MLRGFRLFAASTSLVMAALAVSPYGVAAQTPPPATPPTTRSVLEDLVSNLLPTTTVTPPATRQPVPASPPAGSAPATSPPSALSPTTTVQGNACAGSATPAAGGSSAPGGARSSAPLVEALRRGQPPGAQASDAVVKGMGRFPVGGVAEYSDGWLAARSTPCFHLHKGTDVFAVRGTPVRAPAEGVLRFNEEPVGGRVAYVTEADGTYYYMAHLDSFAALTSGTRVGLGQVVGFVGDSGNASGTHVHLQVHPRGGAPVNPKPFLDRWLDEAMGVLSNRAAAADVSLPRAVAAIDRLRGFEVTDHTQGARTTPLLWAAAVSSGGASIRLAELHLARIANTVDWSARSAVGYAEMEQQAGAQAMARALLWPLTPAAIVAALTPAG